MGKINIEKLSNHYIVRKITEDDVDDIIAIMQGNPLFYEYTDARPTRDDLKRDMTALPNGKSIEDKYYIGFFDDNELIAVMDLIDGYPDEDTAFIGFFMMAPKEQGKGTGSRIIEEVSKTLKDAGFTRTRLAINKGNPQSSSFWKKNGFESLREVERQDGTVILAEKIL